MAAPGAAFYTPAGLMPRSQSGGKTPATNQPACRQATTIRNKCPSSEVFLQLLGRECRIRARRRDEDFDDLPGGAAEFDPANHGGLAGDRDPADPPPQRF